MNIYLDTNILFSDPFFRSSFYNLLVNSSIDKAVAIWIPSICLNELYVKLTNRAQNLCNEINGKIAELNRWENEKVQPIPFNIFQYGQTIRDFYKKKIEVKVFNCLDHTLENFEENLEKAIKKTGPFFTEKKEEFRDGLIWTIIRDHVKKNQHAKNYFVTANYSDFWNSEKTDLHSNLKKEGLELILIDSVKKLFDLEPVLVNLKRKQDFELWLKQQGINKELIQVAVDSYLWNYISNLLNSLIKSRSIEELKLEHTIGYIIPEISRENFEIENIDNVWPVEEFASIQLSCSLRFNGTLFLPNYQKGDFSNSERNQFVADVKLGLTYDRSRLFTLTAASITKLQIE